jgi:hypothetical protein
MLGTSIAAEAIATHAENSKAKNVITNAMVCVCGAKDPAYRGYCRECIAKLKATFDKCLEKFRIISDEYD